MIVGDFATIWLAIGCEALLRSRREQWRELNERVGREHMALTTPINLHHKPA